jgi:hypothetical protein
VISSLQPRRPHVRLSLLALLALAALALGSAAAYGATASAPKQTNSSGLAETLRKYRERTSTTRAGTTGAHAPGATTPTTTSSWCPLPPPPATATTTTSTGATTTTPPATTTPAPATTAPATPAQPAATSKAKASRGHRLSSGAIVVVALAALLVLGCLAWAIARNRAFEPPWLLTLRHASAEAGFRASSTWSELLDWARLGR